MSRTIFFFNDTATTEIYTLSLHDALPISQRLAATECSSTPSTRAAKRGASGVTPTGMGLYTTRQRGDHAQDHYRHRRHAAAPDPEGRGGRVPLHESRLRGDRDLRGARRERGASAPGRLTRRPRGGACRTLTPTPREGRGGTRAP